jgi:2-phosphoglycerate kinase
MRSSYEGDGDPVEDWNDSCQVLSAGIDATVRDAMKRGTSLVLEGVHIQPSNKLIDAWRAQGGTALGVLLMIKDAEAHRSLIFRRGEVTKKGEEKKIKAFARIRKIQDAMFKAAVVNDWLLIEQKLAPDPIEIVTSLLADEDSSSRAVESGRNKLRTKLLDGTERETHETARRVKEIPSIAVVRSHASIAS